MATSKGEKRELLKLVDEQQQQLERYEKRLGDVVAAYKSLHKEKKALELSLKALSLGDTSGNSANGNSEASSSSSTEGSSNDQVATLTKALATLTNERSRMETNFQADKKTLKQEKEELESRLRQEKLELDRQKNALAAEVTELRKKVWSQQMEREKEHSDHAVMLRELQTLVAIERSGKEQLELQLEDLQQSLDRRPDFKQKCVEYQNKIQELSDKLENVKVRLKESEERAGQPQPLLLKLQKELESLKDQHHTSLVQERCRANEAEEQLQQMAQMSEERVANLELKLSELSETVGNYDRIRQQDQQAINGLKERVAQLDRENSLLSGAAGPSVREAVPASKYDEGDDDTNLDIQTLMGRILKIKSLLHAANQRSENPVDLKEFLSREGLSAEPDHSSCRAELGQLKDEFERYKLRAQSVLKNKNNKESSYSKEEETLKRQVIELKHKLKLVSNEMDDKERHYKRTVEELNTLVSRLRQQHSDELSKCQIENRAKMSDMENEMQKHRTRTLLLLEEKENEIKRLKVSLGIATFESRDPEEGDVDVSDQDETRESSLSQLVLLGPNDGQLLHYVQEISRKDLEVATLRRSRHQLETAMRELQTSAVAKEEKFADEIEALGHKLRRLERNVSREGANLEYLKNVVLNYMLSSDAGSRHHMLNAIATLLKFSPKELSSVQQYNKAWWWQHAPKPNETI